LKFSDPPPDAKLSPGESLVGRTDPVEFQFGSQTMTNTLAVLDVPSGLHTDFDGVVGWGPLHRNFFVFDAVRSKATMDAAGQPAWAAPVSSYTAQISWHHTRQIGYRQPLTAVLVEAR